MTDYSTYPYGRMLSYIERRCKELSDDKNYVEYILSMEHAESIEKLIKIYGSCYKVLAYLFFGSKIIPSCWYDTDTWGYKNGWLVDELNYCLNENILRWYKRQKNITAEQALMCISNLRNAINTREIENTIISSSNPYVDYGIKYLSNIRNNHHEIRRGFRKELIKNNYVLNFGYLAAHGYILDAVDISVGKKIGISYDKLIEKYKKSVEAREKREEEARIKLQKEKRRKIIGAIITGLLVIPIGIFFSYIIHEIGLLGIIIIIGFIGAIPKLLLTGHL